MRLALIADIHGNSIALDAVLADAAKQQVTGYCFLGDLVDGHNPSGVLERITSLPNACFVVGNTENYIITGEGPPFLTVESVRQKPERLMAFQEAVQRSHHPAARFITDQQRGNRTVEDMMAAAVARRHMIQSK